VAFLPAWVQLAALALPATSALTLTRHGLLHPSDPNLPLAAFGAVGWLALLAALSLTLGWLSVRLSLKTARKRGSFGIA
jgi:hypothetical protein